ncbi:MAG TPA: hypothetical protein VFT53_04660 [Candidatus Saccharimonadales bacterium]|nr:hypothetical protein [Candidatus Saccharimonadales bacterium]
MPFVFLKPVVDHDSIFEVAGQAIDFLTNKNVNFIFSNVADHFIEKLALLFTGGGFGYLKRLERCQILAKAVVFK